MQGGADDDEPTEAIRANIREWQTFWYWRDKPVGERGAAREVLTAAGFDLRDLRSCASDPPDCEATIDGRRCGIEMTELVHRPTLERSIKAVRQRAAGREPDRAEAHFV